MSLLKLCDIGKIYVSERNVAVGIRNVNLSFEKGEFVAITGKSGSGKSTLLNVISGMDSYEEGELYIQDSPTSHYLQPEWEQYREKYISFIFQDYNIIESFTVLQNVELALMHIEDVNERRRKALELIRRVGLESHIKHKGSRLSGGQKQRTVIARALAKDSPIILADEPTGNLDMQTSIEIIALLKEVSKDKLLIMVTHNFDQVRDVATRHVRVFDGAVVADDCIRAPCEAVTEEKNEVDSAVVSQKKSHSVKNGVILGKTIFAAKPRLSAFVCILLIIGMIGMFYVTALYSGGFSEIFNYKMFTHMDGRVIITAQNGRPLTEDELNTAVSRLDADYYVHYDFLFDEVGEVFVEIEKDDSYTGFFFGCSYLQEPRGKLIGRLPENEFEIALSLPISLQSFFGKNEITTDTINVGGVDFTVCGISYYYDNNLSAVGHLTEKGFELMTTLNYFSYSLNLFADISATEISDKKELTRAFTPDNVIPSPNVENGKVYLNLNDYQSFVSGKGTYQTSFVLQTVYTQSDLYHDDSVKTYSVSYSFNNDEISKIIPDEVLKDPWKYEQTVLVSSDTWLEIMGDTLSRSYKQASLFFENDKEAELATDELRDMGYVAVLSGAKYVPMVEETIFVVITSCMMIAMWFMFVLFLAFFITLCTNRSLGAFRSDMAIMRSMGIKVKVIRVAMFMRMLISMIPALIALALFAVWIYTNPATNSTVTYLYWYQYLSIITGMLFVVLGVTVKQVRRLFGESVKKALKRGDND